ncbi:transcription factor mef2A-like [Aphidius gifuensis]|uniref:transcription factor mef2A-like n=1 Tax=Aphidius gifuensis TaxID=684658 RepID=UPI001CDBF823|nr:transcription factor mef2A-like [Aphidius gifuensis]
MMCYIDHHSINLGIMWKSIFILTLYISCSKSQLNYEGNPLTENTEYTAEETHYKTRHDSKRSKNFDEKSQFMQPYSIEQNKFKTIDSEEFISPGMTLPTSIVENLDKSIDILSLEQQSSSSNDFNTIDNKNDNKLYYTTNTNNINNETQLNNNKQIPLPAKIALNDFLNSKTPEESQWALDNFIKNQQATNEIQTTTTINPNYYLKNSQDYQDFTEQDNSQINNNNMNFNYDNINNNQMINSLENYQNIQHTTSAIPTRDSFNSPVYQSSRLIPWQKLPFQNRNDYIPISRRRLPQQQYRQMQPRVPSRYRAQSRIGPNIIHKPPHLSLPPPSSSFNNYHHHHPHHHKPVEIIYTKPPNLNHHHHGSIGSPPVSYDTPHDYYPNDVHYSQLWSQSYDPHYYDYIAKTGKIKPWLYGKLGHDDHENSGFWSELFVNFKKHGMKNMMNPMFLMGLSIPMLTLMLSALIQKRSFARSHSDYHISEDKINEMVEKVSRAIECYKKNNTRC